MISIQRTTRAFAALVVATILAGCGGSDATGPTAGAPTSITLQSDAGDYIGAGKSYSFSQATAVINVGLSGKYLTVQVTGDEWWHGLFQLPSLEKGTYSGVTRAALDWSGAGRGCNAITGTIIVDEISVVNGALTSLDMRFEQHCEGASPALRGTIHWSATDLTIPPGPSAIPVGLWQSFPEPLPAYSYLYLYSDAGDFIGQGFPWKYASPSTTISMVTSGNRVTVSAAGWTGEFQGMNSIATLKPGYYPGLVRYPFHNPAKGGMSWSGMGRGCNSLTGWFAVDKIVYSGILLTSLDLRFEQHCEGGAAALRGMLHFTGG